MKHNEAIRYFTERLAEGGMDEHDAQTEVLHALSALENCDISTLYLRAQLPITESVEYRMRGIVKRRLSNEPLAYILKERWFMGLPFQVAPAVLIPRQETELLAETAIQFIRQQAYGRVLDICTGSGCIAISIARYTRARVSASDISREALRIARTNAKNNSAPVEFFESDLFDAVMGKFDIITANPPYISEAQMQTLMPEVRDFEPHLALEAKQDGLEFYYRIAEEAPEHLTDRGVLLMEIGEEQGRAVEEIFRKAGFREVSVRKDYSGNDRLVIAKSFCPQDTHNLIITGIRNV